MGKKLEKLRRSMNTEPGEPDETTFRGLRVLHRHRVGARRPFVRVPELVYLSGAPFAVLTWLTHESGRVPAVAVPLNPTKLIDTGTRGVWNYDGETEDPRFSDWEKVGKSRTG
jgi:hypothetical protein